MNLVISIVLVVCVLVAHYFTIELMARYRHTALAFSVFALLSTPLWFAKFDGWFYAVKIFSVWIPLLIFGIIKSLYPTSRRMKKWANGFAKAAFFLLTLNILEATLNGMQSGYMFNAVVGLLLILILPLINKTNWVAANYKSFPFIIYAETPLRYVLIYSSWNICFVYAIYPHYFSIVAISLVYCIFHILLAKSVNYWFTFRTFTLGLILMIRANTSLVEDYLDWSKLHSENIATMWGILNLVATIAYILFEWKKELSQSLIGKTISLVKSTS